MIAKLYFLVSAVSFISAGWFASEGRTAETLFCLFCSVSFFVLGIIIIILKEDSNNEHRN